MEGKIMDKRLYKLDKGKMIDGVCGGIAEYFNIDPSLVRLGWILFSVCGGSGILAYIIAALVIPRKPDDEQL
jgi:phage shock protein C